MTIKRLGNKIDTIKIMSEDVCCGRCEHFVQHYIIDPIHMYGREHYTAINYGHCTYPRLKQRRVEQKCAHFSERRREEPMQAASAEEVIKFLVEAMKAD